MLATGRSLIDALEALKPFGNPNEIHIIGFAEKRINE